MRFGPIELYKKLPKTNCGDCGHPSCLAFATQVRDGHGADQAFQYQPLPRMPLLLLFWDADEEEGFEAQAKVLLNGSAMAYLDLEGLTFVAEKLADNLIS